MLCKYNCAFTRKTSSKNASMILEPQTQSSLRRSWMDAHGKSTVSLQMVEAVKGEDLQVHDVNQSCNYCPGCNPKTQRVFLFAWWKKLFKSAISRGLSNSQSMCPIPPLNLGLSFLSSSPPVTHVWVYLLHCCVEGPNCRTGSHLVLKAKG